MSTQVLRIEALSGRVCNFNKISAFTDGLKPAWLRGIPTNCPLIYIYLYLNRIEEMFLYVGVDVHTNTYINLWGSEGLVWKSYT